MSGFATLPAAPMSKASAQTPPESMKFNPPPAAPARFSGAKVVAHSPDDHPLMHYAARGAWLCHAGRVRRGNEDACLAGSRFSSVSSDLPVPISIPCGPWIVAVSDGIGGHRGGAEASREVVRHLSTCKR